MHILLLYRLSVLIVAALTLCGHVLTEPWYPGWMESPRRDLNCYPDPNCSDCDQASQEYNRDECCSCRSSTTWEGKEVDMFPE